MGSDRKWWGSSREKLNHPSKQNKKFTDVKQSNELKKYSVTEYNILHDGMSLLEISKKGRKTNQWTETIAWRHRSLNKIQKKTTTRWK